MGNSGMIRWDLHKDQCKALTCMVQHPGGEWVKTKDMLEMIEALRNENEDLKKKVARLQIDRDMYMRSAARAGAIGP